MVTVPTPFPVLGDGHDTSPIVTKAWLALHMFGADLDSVTAARLLPMWRHYGQLSPEQVAAVIRRFPRRAIPTLPPGVLGQPIGVRLTVRPRSFGGRS
jgi:hypothetical protein